MRGAIWAQSPDGVIGVGGRIPWRYPGDLRRFKTVTVQYYDLRGELQGRVCTDLVARVWQHEIDHLNGVLFIDRLSGVRRKLLRGRLNKIQRGEVEVDYPIVGSTPPATGTEGR